MINLKCNCCDGTLNTLDIHFTSLCDNRCNHCIDRKLSGLKGISPNPNVHKITESILSNKDNVNDVLFLGGEPCLFLDELIECVKILRDNSSLKLYVTTSVPRTCYDYKDKFFKLIELLDGINLSLQSHKEDIADEIRNCKSTYDRQLFYKIIPYKEKIRINLNIVKPYLCTKSDIIECLMHYNKIGFKSFKLSEISGKDYYVSFEKLFDVKLGSPYSHGCQKLIDMKSLIPDFDGEVLLKRACFISESSLNASFGDLIKSISKCFMSSKNASRVIYEDGTITKHWI